MSLTEARSFVGLPYRLGGRDRNGVDCAGLALLYLREIHKLDLPSDDGQPIRPGWEQNARNRFLAYLDQHGRQMEVPNDGYIILIHILRQAAHMGVMVDRQNVLHIMQDRMAEVSPISFFGHRVLGFWKVVN